MVIVPLVTYLITLLFPSAGVAKKNKTKQAVPTQQVRVLSADEAHRYQYFWLEAVRLDDMERYSDAYELYRHCLDINPDAAEAHFAIARFEMAFDHDSLAQMHYERACALDRNNDEFAERLGQYYLSKGEIQKAATVFEQLSTMAPDRTEYLDMLSRIYQHEKDYKKMLATLNRMETAEGQSEELTLSKMQVYSFMGDTKGAYKELSSLVKSHPNDLNYKVMMGNWLFGNGRKQEALKLYNDVLKAEPDNAQAQMSLMDYYRIEGNEEQSDKLLFAMLENPRTESQTRISLMRQVVNDSEKTDGDSTRILGIFDRILRLPQKTSEMAEMKVAYMSLKKMPTDSIKSALNTVLDISPEKTQARLQLLDIMWRDSIDANVIRECEKAIDYCPDEPALYYYLGLSKYLNDDDKGALDAMRRGVAKISSDTPDEISSRMYMIMGDILHQMDMPAEAYAAYDSCLTYNPDEISCLNNYAYYLSEEGKDLKRAEQMSYKTIKAEPQNGTYLDTYAWILYMQERYEEAKIYIDQVMKVDTAMSAVLYEHAGDIYIKTGDAKGAVELWQKALDNNPENAEEIKKKMKESTL